MSKEETQPCNIGAEKALLGAIFLDARQMEIVAALLPTGKTQEPVFFLKSHQLIFEAVLRLRAAGRPFDSTLIANELASADQLDQIGGSIYLATLFDELYSMNQVPEYCRIVREKWMLRRLIKASKSLTHDLSNGKADPTKVIAKLESLAADFGMEQQGYAGETIEGLCPSAFCSMEFDDRDNMLGDYMICRGATTGFIGPGGIGKSRLLSNMAVSMILGRPWCGIPTTAPGERWLFIQAENSARRTAKDFSYLLRNEPPENHPLIDKNIIITSNRRLIDTNLRLSDPAAIVRLLKFVERFRPAVIVFDPLARFNAGDDENDNMQMMDTLAIMHRIANAAGTRPALIICHHSKEGRTANAGAIGLDRAAYGRGAKAFFDAVRAQINVAFGSDETHTPPIIVACSKNNDGVWFDDRAVRLNPDTMSYDVDNAFEMDEWKEDQRNPGRRKRQTQKAEREISDAEILACLLLSAPVLQKDIEDSVAKDWKRPTVERKINELAKSGTLIIEKEPDGNNRQVNFVRRAPVQMVELEQTQIPVARMPYKDD